MLNFDNILKNYPLRLRGFRENILKEYLQIRILDIIYRSKYAQKLVFLGGTAIRIVHQGTRFSEDIDFDNRGLQQEDFDALAGIIESELLLDGYFVEVKNVFKGAYHCYIKFPGLLFNEGLSGHKKEKILIQIDAESQDYEYSPEKFLINQFSVFRYINTVPLPLLLSQKIVACLNRKRAKGRDFFDVVFLMSKTKPDYRYLEERVDIKNHKEMINVLGGRVNKLNMISLASDVEPFLFDAYQKNRIILFKEWLDGLLTE